jgi:hypothetical protein
MESESRGEFMFAPPQAGTVLLREYQGERLTLNVVPTGYLWRETACASLRQFSPPILEHISATASMALRFSSSLPENKLAA